MPSVQDLMQDERSPLSNIFKQVGIMQRLTQKLNPLLPIELKDQCTVVNLRSGTLVLGVKQQGLLSRMHYLKADLLAILRASEVFQYVKDIKVIAVP
jgi:hypothetical protein